MDPASLVRIVSISPPRNTDRFLQAITTKALNPIKAQATVLLLVGSYLSSSYISRFSYLDLAWQTTERASTRLVARGTAKEHATIGQHPYPVRLFPGFVLPPIASEYPPPRPVTQSSDMPSPQPAPAQKSQKRQAPDGQDSSSGPKLKKTKSKAKTPADGSCMSTIHERN